MFKPNEIVHVQIDPGNTNRTLHAARILEQTDNQITIIFLNSGIYDIIAPPHEVAIFFKDGNKFVRQNAIIDSIIDTSKSRLASCHLQGEVEPAESRECFRAITVLTDLKAHLDNRDLCDILDISASGMAVKSKLVLYQNQKIDIKIEYEGEIYHGPTRIRNIRKMAKGYYRYGMVCCEKRSDKTCLMKGLTQISMNIQREQLKRLAGQH